ncbi:MAG: glycoside hydrolase family 57 protein [Candidatus Kapabacteria bacterium]|nr:glycoside hydrolase family 57 protein [Candidatus Kapabacteria bacterium]
MKKIKIAMMWHFHQPFYRKDGEFILPWTRLHGVKDYKDLPELFYEFPKLRQTINIVPSMWRQLNDYIFNGVSDVIQELTLKDPTEMSADEKAKVLHLFFLCNVENMINPYPDYQRLYTMSLENKELSNQDIIDLQVWYNLTWVGMLSRENPAVKRLFRQGSGFTAIDKKMILDLHLDILSSVKSNLNRLKDLGQLEISVSPYNHPILPLLCDSCAMLEAMPNAELPENLFNYPEDAAAQINLSKDFFVENFKETPKGMWPSEGSISDKALKIMIDSGIGWVASDELVLKKSMKEKYRNEYKYFPIKYHAEGGDITVFFRDHSLSDAIGFQYSGWNPNDAANDFMQKLINIRGQIVEKCGEDALDYAVVPIILDGENCWEYYKNNGVDFLRILFKNLEDSDEVETVLFRDVYGKFSPHVPEISHVQAGSWINADFEIWAGHKEHRIAWSMLSKARNALKNNIDKFKESDKAILWDLMYIAEASDWFWWYGDKHWAPNKFDFDVLFRWYLTKIYELLKINPPEELLHPINAAASKQTFSQATQMVDILDLHGWDNDDVWKNSAKFFPTANQSSMHKVGEIIEEIDFANSDNCMYLRVSLRKDTEPDYEIILKQKLGVNFYMWKIMPQKIEFEDKTSEGFVFASKSSKYFIMKQLDDICENESCEIDFTTHYNESSVSGKFVAKICKKI